ncbi:ABC transporter ATP-binding protein [Virgisporangium ochraceum]|uniref:ABC transporter n=1 Tax=Virgisporangium ochraceum TaxID=65505 RepID=A0A8J4EH15_9ACTN|nr:ABC transporter ATP-binding protein [Virgisporangium ochraceum]GIJ71727.1 ABC transporter [Virgisporangium ochraceum]
MTDVIETEGLTKTWGSLTAVSGLTLRVRAGECYAFLGRNGAGKSTTARLLLDFIRPTRGTARILGGSGSDPSIRNRTGYLPGDLNLPRAMTGADAIAYFGALQGNRRQKDAAVLTERFGLDPKRPVRELSTGNRRKVGLVLAFMSRPELLILDEPTSGLDPVLQEEFRELLAERKSEGASIWLTSHVMAEVERVADRVGLVRDGVLSRELSMEELRRQAADRIRFRFPRNVRPQALATVANVTDVAGEAGSLVVTVDGPVTDLLRRAAQLGATTVETERRDLDEVFLEMFEPEAPA